jgi:hypothetical protein
LFVRVLSSLISSCRRTKRPGQPLREVVLNEADAEFASDWESDDDASSSSPASRIADVDAATDPKTAQALALARRVDRERGLRFPEPAYDAEGRPLTSTMGSGAVKNDVSLAELYHGKPIDQILQEYEGWMTAYFEGATKAAEASAPAAPAATEAGAGGAAAPAAAPSTTPSSASALNDDGERQVENAYIDVCIGMGHVEGLYYALLRKARRLEKGGHAEALKRLQGSWGKWIAQLEKNAGGVFTSGGSIASGKSTGGASSGSLGSSIQETASAASGAGASSGDVALGNLVSSEVIAASAPPLPADEVARVAASTSSGKKQ